MTDQPTLRLISAAEWGLTLEEGTRRGMTPRSPGAKLYFGWHHTAGVHSDDPIEAAQALDYYATHNTREPWSATPYGHLVHLDRRTGNVSLIEARGWTWREGATYQLNDVIHTVVFMGNFDPGNGPQPARMLTPLERTAARFLLGHALENGHLATMFTGIGHRENPKAPNATTCPGDLVMAHKPELLQPIYPSALLGTPKPPPVEPPLPPVVPTPPEAWYHVVAAGETLYGIARALGVSARRMASVNGWVLPGAAPRPPIAPTVVPTLYAGDKLAIPGRSARVLAGDGWIRVTERGELPSTRWQEVRDWNGSPDLHAGMLVMMVGS